MLSELLTCINKETDVKSLGPPSSGSMVDIAVELSLDLSLSLWNRLSLGTKKFPFPDFWVSKGKLKDRQTQDSHFNFIEMVGHWQLYVLLAVCLGLMFVLYQPTRHKAPWRGDELPSAGTSCLWLVVVSLRPVNRVWLSCIQLSSEGSLRAEGWN